MGDEEGKKWDGSGIKATSMAERRGKQDSHPGVRLKEGLLSVQASETIPTSHSPPAPISLHQGQILAVVMGRCLQEVEWEFFIQ